MSAVEVSAIVEGMSCIAPTALSVWGSMPMTARASSTVTAPVSAIAFARPTTSPWFSLRAAMWA